MMIKMESASGGGGGTWNSISIASSSEVSIPTGKSNIKKFIFYGKATANNYCLAIFYDEDTFGSNTYCSSTIFPSTYSDIYGNKKAFQSTAEQLYFVIKSVNTTTGEVVIIPPSNSTYATVDGFWYAE